MYGVKMKKMTNYHEAQKKISINHNFVANEVLEQTRNHYVAYILKSSLFCQTANWYGSKRFGGDKKSIFSGTWVVKGYDMQVMRLNTRIYVQSSAH